MAYPLGFGELYVREIHPSLGFGDFFLRKMSKEQGWTVFHVDFSHPSPWMDGFFRRQKRPIPGSNDDILVARAAENVLPEIQATEGA